MYKKYLKLLTLSLVIIVINTGCKKSDNMTSAGNQTTQVQHQGQSKADNTWNISGTYNIYKPQVMYSDYIGNIANNTGFEWKWKNAEEEISLIQKDKALYISNNSEEYLICENIIDNIDYGKADTVFYKLDITNDGNDDIIVSCFNARGTGSSQKIMFIYDVYNNKSIEIFDNTKTHSTSFTAAQKSDVTDTIAKWINEGFAKKSGLDIDSLKTINTEMFIPSVVDRNGMTAVKVDFKLIGMDGNKQVSSNCFEAILTYSNGEYILKELYYR